MELDLHRMERIHLDLTRQEYDTFLFAMGLGIGVAFKEGMMDLGRNIVTLVNKIGKSINPDFISYEVSSGSADPQDANPAADRDKDPGR